MPELVNLRTRFTKTHDNGDGTRTIEASAAPIHYDDGQGGMAEITREFVPSDRPGYDWMSGDNDFRMHFKENLNQADSMLFIRGGIEVASRPKGVVLHRSDTGAHTVLGTPSNTTCVVDGKNITFFGLYPHCQVRYQNLGDGVKEFIRMTSFAGIPDPMDYGIDPEVVRVGFVTELNPSGHDSMDDGADGSIVENTDYDQISFKKGDVRPIFIPVLAAWSEAWDKARPRTVTKRMKMIGGKPHLIHGLKYADLVARSLPYIIDASFVGYPAVAADDGSSTTINEFFSASAIHYMGRDTPSKTADYSEECFFRFPNVTVPQGSTVSAASFNVSLSGRVGTAQNCRLYLNDADDATAPTSRATHVAKTRTTAYTAFTVGGVSATGYRSISALSPVQEVVNRAGWSSGNAMMVLSDYYGTTTIGYDVWRSVEYTGTDNDPYLSITYTEPASNLSVNDVSLDPNATSATIYGPLTANDPTVAVSVTSATLQPVGGDLTANDVTVSPSSTAAIIYGPLAANDVTVGITTTPATIAFFEFFVQDVTVDVTVTPATITLTAGNLTANDVTVATDVTSATIALTAGNLTANDVTVDTIVTPATIALTAGNLTANDVTVAIDVTSATIALTAGNLSVADITLDINTTPATLSLLSVSWTGTINGTTNPTSVDGVSVTEIVRINGV